LLKKAIGDMKLKEFSKLTGVSTGYLSGLKTGSIKNPPSPDIISKIVNESEERITYRDLMEAAGYITGISEDKPIMSITESMIKLENKRKAINQIVFDFFYQNFDEITIKKPKFNFFRPNMVIYVEDNEKIKCYIDIKPMINDNNRNSTFLIIYGKCAFLELNKNDYYISVTNNEIFYNKMKKYPPKSIKANFLIMLVDIDKEKVVQTDILSSFN